MMLGKRSRAPLKRTTSMTGITVDSEGPATRSLDPQNPIFTGETMALARGPERPPMVGPTGHDQLSSPLLSPRYYTRGSAEDHGLQTAPFLRTCGLCNRRLAPGRDIYMYRGDTAFCSQECREQQMKQDERKEKCSVSKKVESHRNHSELTAAAGSEASNGETVAAA